jgi:hypothetical protein
LSSRSSDEPGAIAASKASFVAGLLKPDDFDLFVLRDGDGILGFSEKLGELSEKLRYFFALSSGPPPVAN